MVNKFFVFFISAVFFNSPVSYAQAVNSNPVKPAVIKKTTDVKNDKAKQQTKDIKKVETKKTVQPKIIELKKEVKSEPKKDPKGVTTGDKYPKKTTEVKKETVKDTSGAEIVEIKPDEAKESIIPKVKNDQVDDLDISTYSYLDNIETSIELLNLILKSNCSKAPDNCKDDAVLAKEANTIVDELRLKHPIGSRLISESQAKYLLMNSLTLKDQLEAQNIEKINRLKSDLKNLNQSLYKEKEAEIIKRWKDSQAAARKIETSVPEVTVSTQGQPNSTVEKTVFVSERDGNPEIYTMNPDGTNQLRLTNNEGYDLMPSWSPDGTKIAFVSERDGNPEIYIMNADGDNQLRLTTNSAYDYSPAWSPDGTKLAFVSNREGSQTGDSTLFKINYKIFVMNTDGTNQTILTENSVADESPKWSPDGTKIAFVSKRDGNAEIYTMNSDGTNPVRLTDNPAFDLMPNWSPDGTRIAFRADRDGNPEIYLMKADGTNQTRLTDNTVADEYPGWSPDGSKIIFVSKRDNVLDNFGILTNEIYVMNADGTNIIRLTNNAFEDYFPNISKPGNGTAAPISLR